MEMRVHFDDVIRAMISTTFLYNINGNVHITNGIDNNISHRVFCIQIRNGNHVQHGNLSLQWTATVGLVVK